MALDNAQFIAELSITDPPGSDPLSQGDDQIRTIKRATQQSFPNVDAAVTLTAAQFNLAAIKNEANVFTAEQTFAASLIVDPSTGNGNVSFDVATVRAWQLRNNVTTNLFSLRRFVAGSFVDEPWKCDNVTGIVDFTQVPTVLGAPLWIAGEIRMFVAAATPGTNWFIADGLNGTVNLDNTVLVGEGLSVPGTSLLPNLVGTAAAGTTGSTAISTAQMPVHTHRIWSANAEGGITDVTFNNGARTNTGANRGNNSEIYRTTTAFGDQVIENSGSGSGHTHSKASAAVTENGVSRDTVRPLSTVVQYHQYVP